MYHQTVIVFRETRLNRGPFETRPSTSMACHALCNLPSCIIHSLTRALFGSYFTPRLFILSHFFFPSAVAVLSLAVSFFSGRTLLDGRLQFPPHFAAFCIPAVLPSSTCGIEWAINNFLFGYSYRTIPRPRRRRLCPLSSPRRRKRRRTRIGAHLGV